MQIRIDPGRFIGFKDFFRLPDAVRGVTVHNGGGIDKIIMNAAVPKPADKLSRVIRQGLTRGKDKKNILDRKSVV